MNKITSSPAIAAALLACGLSGAPAEAGPNRTFVSGTGTDSGTCRRVAPCRTFAFALTQTNAGGEIDVLDPASYGQVIITKAISIVDDGAGVAGITVSSGNGITINASASDSVRLRGLTIEGVGFGTANGILFNTGGNLAIENCVISGFVGVNSAGINIAPSTSSSFSVSNTIASNNPVPAVGGIFIRPTGSAVVSGVLSNVTANNNVDGINVNGFATSAALNVTIVDSETSNNFDIGVTAGGGPAPNVMVRNSVASNNFTGFSGVVGTLRLAHSVATGNNIGVNSTTGTIFSYGDNDIDGNTNDNTGVLTTIPTH